jgi:hypothetical protein
MVLHMTRPGRLVAIAALAVLVTAVGLNVGAGREASARAGASSLCPVPGPRTRLPAVEEVVNAGWRIAPHVLVFSNQRGRSAVDRQRDNVTMVAWLGSKHGSGAIELRKTALQKCPATVVDRSWAVSFEIGSAPTLYMGHATIIIVRTDRRWVAYAYRYGL